MSERSGGLYNEPHRPQFHFTARSNWLNDPNGLVFYGHEYHLFFQHNPQGLDWGNMTWGHAVSRDLVHWTQLDNALYPDWLGTMFSGSAVVDWRNTAGFQIRNEPAMVAIYTAAGDTSPESSGQPYTQCIAYSLDQGRTWIKYEGNPVLHQIAPGNRDPKVVWHQPTNHWILTLYLDGNDFAFFSSADLKTWKLLQKIMVPGCDECPDFFELTVENEPGEQRWVWTAANGQYLLGRFDGTQFATDGIPRRGEFGKNLYAVQTFSDIPAGDGRRIQIGWMRGGEYPGMPFNQQMSFPCHLTLRRFTDGLHLCKEPVREIASLRGDLFRLNGVTIAAGENPLAHLSGDLWDIEVEFEVEVGVDTASKFGFRFGGAEVAYEPATRTLSCLGASAVLEPEDHRLKLRILADRTSIEVYGGRGRVSLSSCYLPVAGGRLELFTRTGKTRVHSLHVHGLHPAWSRYD